MSLVSLKFLQNVSRKVARFLSLVGACVLTSCFCTRLDVSSGKEVPVGSPAFQKEISEATRSPWVSKNAIRTLPNGDAFFPPMLEAVQGARKSITFETFAFVDAPVTRQFSRALAERAQSGVEVKVILDGVGSSNVGKANLYFMREAGVKIELYHPVNILRLRKTNNRTHRKILVVDGKVAYTGGAGFAFAWSGNADSEKHWRDTQYEIKGPAVRGFQDAFRGNWYGLTGKRIEGPSYFPKLGAAGRTDVQVVFDDPWNTENPVAQGYISAINGARKRLLLQQSYFIPNKRFRALFLAAAARGVKVEVIVPNHLIDSKPTRYASQNHWAELLRGGIRIYQYETTMMHGKLLVADGQFSIVGSANLDDRSFFINDEINLHVDSREFAREQTDMFRRDLKVCREITLVNLQSVLEPGYKRFFTRFIESQL